MLNLFAGNQFVIGLVRLILPIILIILVFILIALIIKKRATSTGFMFFLLLSALCYFIELTNEGKFYNFLSDILLQVGVGYGIVNTVQIIAFPVKAIHLMFLDLLIIMNLHNDVVLFFKSEIFVLLFYVTLFIINIFVAKSKHHEKKTYSDYDS